MLPMRISNATLLLALAPHVRRAHHAVINAANSLFDIVADCDGDFPDFFTSEVEDAASRIEAAARSLRDALAIYRAALPDAMLAAQENSNG